MWNPFKKNISNIINDSDCCLVFYSKKDDILFDFKFNGKNIAKFAEMLVGLESGSFHEMIMNKIICVMANAGTPEDCIKDFINGVENMFDAINDDDDDDDDEPLISPNQVFNPPESKDGK